MGCSRQFSGFSVRRGGYWCGLCFALMMEFAGADYSRRRRTDRKGSRESRTMWTTASVGVLRSSTSGEPVHASNRRHRFFLFFFSLFPFLRRTKFLRSGKSTGQCLGTTADISIDPKPPGRVEVCSRRPRDVFLVQTYDPWKQHGRRCQTRLFYNRIDPLDRSVFA